MMLSNHLQTELPHLDVVDIELFDEVATPVRIVGTDHHQQQETRIKVIRTKTVRIEMATSSNNGTCYMAGLQQRDAEGKRHGWQVRWYEYEHHVQSERLYNHGVLLQESTFEDQCDHAHRKFVVWDKDTKKIRVKSTRSSMLTRKPDGSYDRNDDYYDTVFDRHYSLDVGYDQSCTRSNAAASAASDILFDKELNAAIVKFVDLQVVVDEFESNFDKDNYSVQLRSPTLPVTAHVYARGVEFKMVGRSEWSQKRDIKWKGKYTRGSSWCRGSRILLEEAAGGFVNFNWFDSTNEPDEPFLKMADSYRQEFCGESVWAAGSAFETTGDNWYNFDSVEELEKHLLSYWSSITSVDYWYGNFDGFIERLRKHKTDHPNARFVVGYGQGCDMFVVINEPLSLLRELDWVDAVITKHNVAQEWV